MTRQQFILEARTWIGVPWRHQGRTRQGIDCVGLLVRVAQDCGMAAIDVTSYRRMGENQQLKALCEQQLLPITEYRPGDLLRMVTDIHGQHMGLVTDHPDGLGLLHASALFRKVVEHRLDIDWLTRTKTSILAAYALPGVD